MAASRAENSGAASSVQGTASFSKFMTVLQAIADAPGEMDMARLTRTLPYPRGTIYRIVSALIAEGLVAERRGSSTFELGHRLIQLAGRSWEGSDLRSTARVHLEALRDDTGETVHLAVPSGTGMVYIDKLESPRTVRMNSRVGTRVEMYSTSVGKAYLAACTPERAAEIVSRLDLTPRTVKTITDPASLIAEIDLTRRIGNAFDDEENEPEIRCFGGAIVDRDGDPVGAISLSIPIHRFDPERADEVARKVRATVLAISADLASIV